MDVDQEAPVVHQLRSVAEVGVAACHCSLIVTHLGDTVQRSDADPVLCRDMSATGAAHVAGAADAEDTAVTLDADDVHGHGHPAAIESPG